MKILNSDLKSLQKICAHSWNSPDNVLSNIIIHNGCLYATDQIKAVRYKVSEGSKNYVIPSRAVWEMDGFETSEIKDYKLKTDGESYNLLPLNLQQQKVCQYIDEALQEDERGKMPYQFAVEPEQLIETLECCDELIPRTGLRIGWLEKTKALCLWSSDAWYKLDAIVMGVNYKVKEESEK